MATVTLKGNPIHTNGDLPAKGANAPAFTLTAWTSRTWGSASGRARRRS